MPRVLVIVSALVLGPVWPAAAQSDTGGSAPAMVEPVVEPAPAPTTAATPAGPTGSMEPPARRKGDGPAPLMDVPNVPSAPAMTRAVAAWKAYVSEGQKDLAGGRWAEAESHFRASLVLDPADPIRLGLLAKALEGRGALRAAALVLRQAVALSTDRTKLAERWAAVARIAEQRKLSSEALSAWLTARSLSRTTEYDARIEELSEIEIEPLMSPFTLCPILLDEWGCSPSTRRQDGGMRCSCTLEQVLESAEAIAGGVITTDRMAVTSLYREVILAAALIRVQGQGIGLLDTVYLAVETGSGGWQLVGRVKEGWQPGAVYTAREGRIEEVAFIEIGQPARHGSTLVMRTLNRSSDADLDGNTLSRDRLELLYVCHGRGKVGCATLPLAMRWKTEVLRPDGPQPPAEAMFQTDWEIRHAFGRDGTITLELVRGDPPQSIRDMLGTYPIEELYEREEVWPIPLR